MNIDSMVHASLGVSLLALGGFANAQIFVYDAATREQTHVIDMPNWGEPHGLVWVHYDMDGNARVVRDQGGFRGGIDPMAGVVLDY